MEAKGEPEAGVRFTRSSQEPVGGLTDQVLESGRATWTDRRSRPFAVRLLQVP